MRVARGMRLAILLAALTFSAALAPHGGAQTSTPAPIRVAVLDTGIDPSHPEFAAGQVVAWWDFTNEQKPNGPTDPFTLPAGQRAWDPLVQPYDPHGHGTATASLVGGANIGACASGAKASFAPGVELIVAKLFVGTRANATPDSFGDIGRAIRWSVEQGADVISMSLGAAWPYRHAEADIQAAEAAGVLVVVATGNSVNTVGWASRFGNSPLTLSVAAASRLGMSPNDRIGGHEPDVTSWGINTCAASLGGGYRMMNGSSFAAPLVSGMAAKAIETARANGQPDDPAHLRELLKRSAANNVFQPYAREGLGHLFVNQWPTVAAHAAAGTLPDYDAQGGHAAADRLYHETVVMALRQHVPHVPFPTAP